MTNYLTVSLGAFGQGEKNRRFPERAKRINRSVYELSQDR